MERKSSQKYFCQGMAPVHESELLSSHAPLMFGQSAGMRRVKAGRSLRARLGTFDYQFFFARKTGQMESNLS